MTVFEIFTTIFSGISAVGQLVVIVAVSYLANKFNSRMNVSKTIFDEKFEVYKKLSIALNQINGNFNEEQTEKFNCFNNIVNENSFLLSSKIASVINDFCNHYNHYSKRQLQSKMFFYNLINYKFNIQNALRKDLERLQIK